MVAGCRVKAQLQQRHHFGVPTGARTAAVWGPNRCRSVHRTLQLCVNAWVPLDTSGDGGGRSTLDPGKQQGGGASDKKEWRLRGTRVSHEGTNVSRPHWCVDVCAMPSTLAVRYAGSCRQVPLLCPAWHPTQYWMDSRVIRTFKSTSSLKFKSLEQPPLPVDGTAACVSQAQLDMSRRCRPTTSHVHLNSRDTCVGSGVIVWGSV